MRATNIGSILSTKNNLSLIYNKLSNRRYLFPILLLLLLGITVPSLLGVMQWTTTIRTAGSIKAVNVGVYSDSGCTTPLANIDWGVLEGGNTVTRTAYIKNSGNTAMTLSMSVGNWVPTSASSYIQLTWNYSGQTLNPGQSLAVTLTLTVSTSITGITSFSFDITIVGTG